MNHLLKHSQIFPAFCCFPMKIWQSIITGEKIRAGKLASGIKMSEKGTDKVSVSVSAHTHGTDTQQ